MSNHSKALRKRAMALTAATLTMAMVSPVLLNSAQFKAHAAEGYTSTYNETQLQHEMENLNLQIAQEGSVLLKNNGVLPLVNGERNLTVFHSIWDPWHLNPWCSNKVDNMEAGGSGNGGSGGIVVHNPHGIYEGLENNGFRVNSTLRNMYTDYEPDYKENKSDNYINNIDGPNLKVIQRAENSFVGYNDAAIITISRQESEGVDLFGFDFFDKTQKDVDHYLQLNTGEKALIAYAKQHFDKIIVVLNTGMPLEIKELKDDADIDAVLWSGIPGENGLLAIGDILSGKISPSGRLADTWAADFTHDPSYQNMATGEHILGDGDRNSDLQNGYYGLHGVDYQEGIYVGYRYYETAYAEAQKGNYDGFIYDNEVVYPFGYGLSYTAFKQEIVEDSFKTDGETISFNVKVTNTGAFTGKEVVQVYYNPVYTAGGIEKASANLVAFAKTKTLKKGQSETVTISFDKRDMASYDYNDANKDGHKGYELEAGDYEIILGKNSHETWESKTYNHTAQTNFDTDKKTGAKIEQLFSGGDAYDVDRTYYMADNYEKDEDGNYVLKEDAKGVDFMSRADFNTTFPQHRHDTGYGYITHEDIDPRGDRHKTYENTEEKDSYGNPGVAKKDEEGALVKDGEGKQIYIHNVAVENTEYIEGNSFAKVNEDGEPVLQDGKQVYYHFVYLHQDLYEPMRADLWDDIFWSQRGGENTYNASKDNDTSNPWYKGKSDIPEGWTQAADTSERVHGYTAIQLCDMVGIDLNGTTPIKSANKLLDGKTGREAWDLYMNQLTFKEIGDLVCNGYFKTIGNLAIGKPQTDDNDGPAQLRNHESTEYSYGFASGVVVASTFNTDLAEKYGVLMGEWAILHNMTGWYGPSMNIHRSPFCGRNYEYFSEDGLLSGKIAAQEVKGATSRGIISYIKHFAMNNQETYRSRVHVFTNEQTMREIYFKPFEYAIKEGGSNGIMMSMNGIGAYQTAMNYRLTVNLLQEEWGYDGIILSDYTSNESHYWMIRCQVVPLASGAPVVEGEWSKEKNCVVYGETEDYTLWYAARKIAEKVLYNVANSNAVDPNFNYSDFWKKEIVIEETADGGRRDFKQILFADENVYPDYVTLKRTEDGKVVEEIAITKDVGSVVLDCGIQMYFNGQSFVMLDTAGVWEYEYTGYVRDNSFTAKLTIIVKPVWEFDKVNGTVGQEFDSQITYIEDCGKDEYAISKVTVADGSLPKGLTVNSDGTITGTPKETGKFTVKFGVYDLSGKVSYFTQTLNIVEGEEAAPEFRVEEGMIQFSEDGGKTWVDVIELAELKGDKGADGQNGTTPTVSISEDGFWVINGVKTEVKAIGVDGKPGQNGTNGADGKDGVDGKDAEGGCNSTVGAASGAVAIGVVALALGGVIIAKRKKENN